MKKLLKIFLILNLVNPLNILVYAYDAVIPLQKANIEPMDKASLQRGFKYFMNYCSGCHSLQYLRYNQVSQDLGIADYDGKVYTDTVKDNLMFNTNNFYNAIKSSMSATDGAKWFGVAAPDLTLVTRWRNPDWVYTYLKSFYLDDKRPWGVNNLVFKNVAMPNVLGVLQGQQVPEFSEVQQLTAGQYTVINKVFRKFNIIESGALSAHEFDQVVLDIVNFLTYAGEPVKQKRLELGVWVMLFLGVLTILTYLVKREYWKDVH